MSYLWQLAQRIRAGWEARSVNGLSPAIQWILPILAEDQGRFRAKTLENIHGPGPVAIRQHLNLIDAALGADSPGLTGLEALVVAAETAVDMSQPARTRQHLTSQVVFKQFVESTRKGNVLTRYDVTKHTIEDLGPYGVGYIDEFVPIDSEAIENLWGITESKIPGTIAAATTRTAIGDPGHEAILRQVVALHFVRHPQILEAHEKGWGTARQDSIDRLLWTSFAADAFRQRTGLVPAGPEARRMGLDAAQERLIKLHENGALFRLTAQRLFELIGDRFGARPVAIWMPANPNKEFLIGDMPAIGRILSTGAAGVGEDVGADNADQILMPITPSLTIVVGSSEGYRAISDADVDELNQLQVRKASQYVHYRPSAGFATDLPAWRP